MDTLGVIIFSACGFFALYLIRKMFLGDVRQVVREELEEHGLKPKAPSESNQGTKDVLIVK